ncbi:MAG: glycosyltransferase [archaeon]
MFRKKQEPNNMNWDDVTLCMIVRDELINPAGGIYTMLKHHLPLFSNAVVMDTGSTDGTRQILEHLQGEYPHLHVFDGPFKGFAQARNAAKRKVKTPFVMSLDADEYIPEEEKAKIAQHLSTIEKPSVVCIGIENINTRGDVTDSPCWFDRIYPNEGTSFKGKVWEGLYGPHPTNNVLYKGGKQLLHFIPDDSGKNKKRNVWYDSIDRHIGAGRGPAEQEAFLSWKLPNPAILTDYGIDYEKSIAELRQLGLLPENLAEKIMQESKPDMRTADEKLAQEIEALRLATETLLQVYRNSPQYRAEEMRRSISELSFEKKILTTPFALRKSTDDAILTQTGKTY